MKKRSHEPTRADDRDETHARDAELFEKHMVGVVRLNRDPRGRFRAVPPPHPPRVDASSHAGMPSAVDDFDSESPFVAAGVDRRELRKLKRGDHRPALRLDLHGHTAADAVVRVATFIEGARHKHRAVCIVHGRGLHSAGNTSVLKGVVRACLRQHRAVLAYADAPRSDGGPGAVYVLLRK